MDELKYKISEKEIFFEVNNLFFPALVSEIDLLIGGKKQIYAICDSSGKKSMIISIDSGLRILHFKPLIINSHEFDIPVWQIIEKNSGKTFPVESDLLDCKCVIEKKITDQKRTPPYNKDKKWLDYSDYCRELELNNRYDSLKKLYGTNKSLLELDCIAKERKIELGEIYGRHHDIVTLEKYAKHYGDDKLPYDLECIARERTRQLEYLYGVGKELFELENMAKRHKQLEEIYGTGKPFEELQSLAKEHDLLKKVYGDDKSFEKLKKIAADRRLVLEITYGTGKRIDLLEEMAIRHQELEKEYGKGKTFEELVSIEEEHEFLKKLYGYNKPFEELKKYASDRRLELEKEYGLGKSLEVLEKMATRHLALKQAYGSEKPLEELNELERKFNKPLSKQKLAEDYTYWKDLYV